MPGAAHFVVDGDAGRANELGVVFVVNNTGEHRRAGVTDFEALLYLGRFRFRCGVRPIDFIAEYAHGKVICFIMHQNC